MDTGHGEAATSGADAGGGGGQPVLVVIYTGWWIWNIVGKCWEYSCEYLLGS